MQELFAIRGLPVDSVGTVCNCVTDVNLLAFKILQVCQILKTSGCSLVPLEAVEIDELDRNPVHFYFEAGSVACVKLNAG